MPSLPKYNIHLQVSAWIAIVQLTWSLVRASVGYTTIAICGSFFKQRAITGASVSADFPLPVLAVMKTSTPWQRSRVFSICQAWGVWIPSHSVNMARIHSLGWDDRHNIFFLKSVILRLYSALGKAHISDDMDVNEPCCIGESGQIECERAVSYPTLWAGANWGIRDWFRVLGFGFGREAQA